MELISVIMPTYNVENYIEEAIDSILRQTYTNFELIIVDDCSTDRTYQKCLDYSKKDTRIKLYKNEQNSKIEFTLNKALEYSSGKYIVRMDGDDISDSRRLEIMKNYLDDHLDIKLVGTSTITINADGKEIGKNVAIDDFSIIQKTCLLKTPVVHIWMTYKTIYDELNGYRKFFASEDYDFVLRLISKGYKCSNISEYFGYKVRINRIGNSSSTYGVKKLKSKWYTGKLYKQRLRKGFDTYSLDNCQKYIKTSKLTESIYSKSNTFLYKAIEKKAQKKYFMMLLYTVLALISPYQILYLSETLRYKIYTRNLRNNIV